MKRAVHAVAWVLLVVAALVLWPQRFGGAMTYVITTGTSMHPAFTAGDLAVLREADDYGVGDVVAHRSKELDRVVMHRVIAEREGAFTLQGDNNDFVDPSPVLEGEVLGRLVVRVPQVGTALGWATKPLNLLLLLAGCTLLVGDRRSKRTTEPTAEPIAELELNGLHVPDATVVADLADEAALRALAARTGRPVLRDRKTGELFVHDGAVLYRHDVVAARELVERGRGAGRDWNYEGTAGLVPRPRRAPVEPPARHLRRVS